MSRRVAFQVIELEGRNALKMHNEIKADVTVTVDDRVLRGRFNVVTVRRSLLMLHL